MKMEAAMGAFSRWRCPGTGLRCPAGFYRLLRPCDPSCRIRRMTMVMDLARSAAPPCCVHGNWPGAAHPCPHSMIAKYGRILQLIASGNSQQEITCASPKREDRRCKTNSKPETIQNVIASITKHN